MLTTDTNNNKRMAMHSRNKFRSVKVEKKLGVVGCHPQDYRVEMHCSGALSLVENGGELSKSLSVSIMLIS
jgi:hypothetical protein